MRRPALIIGAAIATIAYAAHAVASGATAGIVATIQSSVAGASLVQPLVLPTVSATAVSTGSTISSGGLTAVSGASVVSAGTTAVGGGAAAVSGATVTGNSATAAISAPVTGNATLTIHGQAGDTVSTAVPDSFQVVRSGGTDTLTVKTSSNVQSSADNGVILGGTVMSRDTLSVDIGGSIALASNGPVMPGPYEGLLVVVVQYN